MLGAGVPVIFLTAKVAAADVEAARARRGRRDRQAVRPDLAPARGRGDHGVADDRPAHRAELDRARAAAQCHRVAVGEEAGARLEQAAVAAGLGAGDRPGGEQVAGAHGRAVDGRVRELLWERPVQVAGVAARDRLPVHLDLERDVERPVTVGPQIVVRLRVLLAGGDEVGLERGQRRDPGRDRRREGLAQERAERAVLEALDVPRAPVVDEHEAEDVIAYVGGADRVAERLARARDEPELELEVQLLGGAVARPQPARAHDLGAGDDDRAGAAVVADRQRLPGGRERIAPGGTCAPRWWRARSTSRSRRSRRPRAAAPARRSRPAPRSRPRARA